MKLLILGTGHAQADAIRYGRDRGWTVHALAYRAEGPGVALADAFAVVDIRDRAAVAAYARTVGADLVYSVGSDVAMPSVARASAQCGLPCFFGEEAADRLQHKGRFRALQAEQHRAPLPFRTGRAAGDFADFDAYPAVLKPVDSQGQRGVTEVDNFSAVRAALARTLSFSPSGEAVLERRVPGPEFSCNAFFADGALRYAFLSDRESLPEYPGGLVKTHVLPAAREAALRPATGRLAAALAAAIGLRDGPMYLQLRDDPETGPVPLDVAPRLDGCHLWRLIRLRYGVDLLDLAFRALAGETPTMPDPRPAGPPLRLVFDHLPPGALFAGRPHPAGTLYDEDYYVPGETIRPVNGLCEKTGYRIESCPDVAGPETRS